MASESCDMDETEVPSLTSTALSLCAKRSGLHPRSCWSSIPALWAAPKGPTETPALLAIRRWSRGDGGAAPRAGSAADALGQERVAEHALVRQRGLARLDADHLDADVVGAGLDMGVEFLDDGVEVASEHEVVDEVVAAAARELLVRVAQPAELRDVVLGGQVGV